MPITIRRPLAILVLTGMCLASARGTRATPADDPLPSAPTTANTPLGVFVDARLQLANAADLRIPHCVETVDEAIAIVRQVHAESIGTQHVV